jgi:hypothetical protein
VLSFNTHFLNDQKAQFFNTYIAGRRLDDQNCPSGKASKGSTTYQVETFKFPGGSIVQFHDPVGLEPTKEVIVQ